MKISFEEFIRDFDELPPGLSSETRTIFHIVGNTLGARIVDRYNGTDIDIPSKPKASNVLVKLIGLAAAKKLADWKGGDRVYVPVYREAYKHMRDRRIVAEYDGGASIKRLAQKHSMTPQKVKSVLNGFQAGFNTETGNDVTNTCCSFVLDRSVNRDVRLLPAGYFRSLDGRPVEPGLEQGWLIDDKSAATTVDSVLNLDSGIMIDYEHQSLHSECLGHSSPAAGWFNRVEWRSGDGLYALDVRWTERARRMIERGEYRYLSPVFDYDPETGIVGALHSVGLTNTPALDGLDDLLKSSVAVSNKENRLVVTGRSLCHQIELINKTSMNVGEASHYHIILGLDRDGSDLQEIQAKCDQIMRQAWPGLSDDEYGDVPKKLWVNPASGSDEVLLLAKSSKKPYAVDALKNQIMLNKVEAGDLVKISFVIHPEGIGAEFRRLVLYWKGVQLLRKREIPVGKEGDEFDEELNYKYGAAAAAM